MALAQILLVLAVLPHPACVTLELGISSRLAASGPLYPFPTKIKGEIVTLLTQLNYFTIRGGNAVKF